VRRKVFICATSLLLAFLAPVESSASSKVGTKCSTPNKVSGNLICKKVKSALVWQKKSSAKVKKPNYLPKLVPVFSLRTEGTLLLAQLSVPSSDSLANDSIQEVQVFYYVNKEPNQRVITSGKSNLRDESGSFGKTISFRMDTEGKWEGVEITVGMKFINTYGAGLESKQSIQISSNVLQQPSQTNSNCKPSLTNTLPWSSQRIALISMNWFKDSLGYVSVNLRLRNDNQANLRIVNYSLDYSYAGVKKTTAYNAGGSVVNHFFVKDDPVNMGLDKIPGAWLSGQEREFKIDLREILDCTLISLSSENFKVISGVGDN
jgi:hypothetical protein